MSDLMPDLIFISPLQESNGYREISEESIVLILPALLLKGQ